MDFCVLPFIVVHNIRYLMKGEKTGVKFYCLLHSVSAVVWFIVRSLKVLE